MQVGVAIGGEERFVWNLRFFGCNCGWFGGKFCSWVWSLGVVFCCLGYHFLHLLGGKHGKNNHISTFEETCCKMSCVSPVLWLWGASCFSLHSWLVNLPPNLPRPRNSRPSDQGFPCEGRGSHRLTSHDNPQSWIPSWPISRWYLEDHPN